tara:strand:- start:136 stop:1371 length:1236 start_codon:yes stop_codon:yes gene_type:complete
MSSIQINGNTSGSITIEAPAVAGTNTLTLPASSGTVLTSVTTTDITVNGITVGRGGGDLATNTAVGSLTLTAAATGNYNSAFGRQALQSLTSGNFNTGIGQAALYTNTSGSNNTAVGQSALGANTTGSSNVGIGKDALSANTTASNNVAVGYQALLTNTTAENNTAVGYIALKFSTGTANTAVGRQALTNNTTGTFNTGSGVNALFANTTGIYNTTLGAYAGGQITTGTYNNILGSLDTTLTTGSYNMLLGRFANVQSSATGYALVLNTDNTPRTDKGNNTGYIFTGGSVYQGNNSASWATVSDERLKKNIVDNNDGLNKINQIQIRNFEYRPASEVTDLPETQAVDKEGTQLGVIAQEIQQVLPDMVSEESTGVLSVDTGNLSWYLVNAVKELSAKVEALQTELAILKGN